MQAMTEPARRTRRQWEAYVELHVHKISAAEMTRQMIADGYSAQEAAGLIGKQERAAAKTNISIMVAGVGFFLVGALLSISSRSAASSSGGTFYVFIGAMLVGPVAFFYGLARLLSRGN
jgi:hypothetical protein